MLLCRPNISVLAWSTDPIPEEKLEYVYCQQEGKLAVYGRVTKTAIPLIYMTIGVMHHRASRC